MDPMDRAGNELAAAAAVRSARDDVVEALGPLAASPLDEGAVDQMRRALARVDSPVVRSALRRLIRPPGMRPSLASVPNFESASTSARTLGPPRAAEDRASLGGGAA